MKVLVVGVYRDGSGYSQACIDYILALDSVGIDVVCRPLKLNGHRPSLPMRILELEAKSSSGADVCIQHMLPHQMDYNGRLYNIGLYASETSHFKSSVWAERLNNMDEALVINRQMVEAARASGVRVPLTVVPHAIDISRFQQSYEPLDYLKEYRQQGDFLFYTIGEMTRRKNLAALLKAFHTEFSERDLVRLVIKTSIPGKSAGECKGIVGAFCEEIRRGLKTSGSRSDAEIVLTERLTDNDILRLHASCNCFVQPSYGEAWSLPAMAAMGMGKTPIVTACTGYLDYLSDDTGWLVPYQSEPVFGVQDSFADLYTGTEEWCAVSIPHLRKAMRQAFEEESLREEKAANGVQRAYDFSYEAIGLRMKQVLYGLGQTA